MLIIVSGNIKSQELDELLTQYDMARNRDQQEQIAQRIYATAGTQIQAMIRRAAGERKLNQDQLDTLAWQALMTGLSECGMTRFKKTDGTWETFVARCRQPGFAPGQKIWTLLSPDLRKALANPYLKSTTVDALLKELNALVRRRDFYDATAWAGIQLGEKARQLLTTGLPELPASELTHFNCLSISAAFPEIRIPEAPPRNLFGYISKFVIPKMKPEIWETADGRKVDPYLTEVYNAVRPDIEAVRSMESEGTLPDEWASMGQAERIYRHHKARLDTRYGPAIKWWNERVRELQPGNPFQVNDHGSLKAAKDLLEQHRLEIPEAQWKTPTSKYHLPVAALYPNGQQSIQRMLDGQAVRSQTSVPAHAVAPSAPAIQAPAWAQSLAGRQQEVYALIVNRIYSGSQHDIERTVGLFLAHNPKPSSQSIAAFLQSLAPDEAELIEEEGWASITRQIDRAVLDEIRKPATQSWLSKTLGQPQAAVKASVLSIRQNVFVRTAESAVEGGRFNTEKMTRRSPFSGRAIIISRLA